MFTVQDRVKESSITEGNGEVIVLNDTFGGFSSFSQAVGSGNSTFYTIENNENYEIGIGTYNPSNNSLSRDVILESTNDNDRINLFGVSVVFGTYPGTHSFFLNDQGYASGQPPYYSGVAFPDGRVQNVAYQGSGEFGHLAFFTDKHNFDSNHYLTWSDATSTLNVSGVARLYSDVYISGNLEVAGTQTIVNTQVSNTEIDLTTLTNTTFRIDDAAGCFFHAFVDNDDDNMVALYSTNESRPTWRLGLKDFSASFAGSPSRGFVFGDKDSIGGVADNITDNLYILNASNGFWVKHIGRDILNVQRNNGINFYNDSPVVVPLTLRGASAQATHLQEWQSYAGSVLASISKDGQISVPSIKFPDGTTQSTANIGSLTIGSGTVNAIPKFLTSTSFTDSVISESGGRIGIGTTIPSGKLHIQDGTLHILNDGSVPQFELVDTDTDNSLRLNSTNSVFAFNLDPDQKIAGSELRFNVDNSDKFILKHNINEFKQSTQVEANNNLVQFGNSITVINANEENIDLQVKGDSDPHLLYCDASTDRVGIGTSTPAHTLDVNGGGQFVHPPSGCGLTVANAVGHGLQFGECAYGSYGSSYTGDLYTGVTHTKLDASQEYILLSKGDHTFISAKDGYASIIRGGNNHQTYQLLVNKFMFSVGQYNEKMKFDSTKVAFNLNNQNLDFAVHGSLDNLIYADASTDSIGIGTDSPTQKLDIDSSGIRIRDDHTPASASANGNKGEIVWDSNYLYICVATNTWKRAALSTW